VNHNNKAYDKSYHWRDKMVITSLSRRSLKARSCNDLPDSYNRRDNSIHKRITSLKYNDSQKALNGACKECPNRREFRDKEFG